VESGEYLVEGMKEDAKSAVSDTVIPKLNESLKPPFRWLTICICNVISQSYPT
jgi:hypothetical protein